jgi:hypothetical protein
MNCAYLYTFPRAEAPLSRDRQTALGFSRRLVTTMASADQVIAIGCAGVQLG